MSHFDPFKKFDSAETNQKMPDHVSSQFGVRDPASLIFRQWRSNDPGRSREVVYQPFQTTNFAVTSTPMPLGTQNQIVDALIIALPTTATASIFIGQNSSVTTGNGFPIEAGTSVGVGTDNQSQMYEIRSAIENLTALMASIFASSVPPTDALTAPRLVFRLSDFYLVSATAQTANLWMFFPPEKGA